MLTSELFHFFVLHVDVKDLNECKESTDQWKHTSHRRESSPNGNWCHSDKISLWFEHEHKTVAKSLLFQAGAVVILFIKVISSLIDGLYTFLEAIRYLEHRVSPLNKVRGESHLLEESRLETGIPIASSL